LVVHDVQRLALKVDRRASGCGALAIHLVTAEVDALFDGAGGDRDFARTLSGGVVVEVGVLRSAAGALLGMCYGARLMT
jgi:hypothetical protein